MVPVQDIIMNSRSPSSQGKLKQHRTVKPVNLICIAPAAQAVSVIGDFNEWHPNAHPMTRQMDGSWHASIPMGHGHHRYAFYVDGVVTLDPKANGVSRDDQDNRVSLISVS
jgi:1,4-alpha-glucan branching enzyme